MSGKSLQDTVPLKTLLPYSIFRAQMLNQADQNKNNLLTYLEALAVNKITNATSNPKNYKGIEVFQNLDSLYLERPDITSIDLSKNDKMTFLDIHWQDNLTSVVVSKKAPFVFIRVSDNGLTSFDASGLIHLKTLLVGAQRLTYLNIQNTTLTYLNAFENPEISVCVNSEAQWNAIPQNDLRKCGADPLATYCKYKLTCINVTGLENEPLPEKSSEFKTLN